MRQPAPFPDEPDAKTASQIVLVPGTSVPLVSLDLPPGLRGQAREQVAARQVSDRLGLKSDQIALRPYNAGLDKGSAEAWTQVLVADKDWLASLVDLPGRAVLPDYLSLPAAPEIWTISATKIEGALAVMVRLGPQDGFTAAPALARVALRRALQDGPAPKAILAIGVLPNDLQDLASAQNIRVFRSAADLAASGLAKPRVLGFGELGLDLRNSPTAARARLKRQLRPWVWAFAASALAAAVWGAGQWWAIQSADNQTLAYKKQITAAVQQDFTNGGPVLDARVQVTRALADLKAQDTGVKQELDPLDLGTQIAQILSVAGAQTNLFHYRQDEGLRIVVQVSDFAAVDQLAEAIRADGLDVVLQDRRTENGVTGVRADLIINPAQETDQ